MYKSCAIYPYSAWNHYPQYNACSISHGTSHGLPVAHAAQGRGIALRWRHNGRDCVLNHQPYPCLFNLLLGRRSKKTSKRRVTGLCEGNSPGTGEFPTQMTSNAENVSIWWRHHVLWVHSPNKVLALILAYFVQYRVILDRDIPRVYSTICCLKCNFSRYLSARCAVIVKHSEVMLIQSRSCKHSP